MNFSVSYQDPDELLADHAAQFLLGGFLVRVTPPDGIELYSSTTLTVTYADLEATLQASVVQVIEGAGVAVGFESVEALEDLVAHAKARTGAGGIPATHAVVEKEPESPPAPEQAAKKPTGPNRAQKIRMARNGDRPDRDLILRDTDRSLQRFLITNPGLSLGEVKFMAGMATTLPQTLKSISEKREWATRPEIALAIIRNPRSPIPIALKVLPSVGMGELRQLVRGGHLRTPILSAARKRVNA